MYRPLWETSGLQDQGFQIEMLWGTGSTNQCPTVQRFVPTERVLDTNFSISEQSFDSSMLFLLLFCSPLPRRGLLVRVRLLVKGRVCRSPFCIKVLALHPSLFAVVTHSPNFLILLTPPKTLEKTFSIKANHLCVTTPELLALHFCQNEVLFKRGFGVFTGWFPWCCPDLFLPVGNVFAFQQSDWSRVLNALVSRNI